MVLDFTNEQERIKVRHKLGGTNEVYADTLVPMVDGEVWKFGNIIIDSQEQNHKENGFGSDQQSPDRKLANNSPDTHTKDYGHKELIDKDYEEEINKLSLGKFVKEKEQK